MSRRGLPVLIDSMSPQVRRIFAVGLLGALGVLTYFALVQPVFLWSASQLDGWLDTRFALDRAKVAIKAGESVSLASVEAEETTLRSMLLSGATEAEAAAELQAVLIQALGVPGLVTESFKSDVAQDKGPMRRLFVEWRGRGVELSVMQGLNRLDEARPLLRIERMALRTIDVRDNEATISLELRLYGLWAPPLAAAIQSGESEVVGTGTATGRPKRGVLQ